MVDVPAKRITRCCHPSASTRPRPPRVPADQRRPPAVVFRPEDRRHAVVNAPDELVRRRGDDAEGSDPLAGGRVLPVLPKARETERRPVLHGYGVGLLNLRAFDRHPLEEAVDRHDAAALAICLTEHRQPIDRLRFGVDRRRLRLVLAPVRDEPPLKQVERALAGLGVLPDYPELLARGAVVAWRHVAERIASDPIIPRVESIDDFEPELIGRARLDDASTHVVHVGGELAWWKRVSGELFSVRLTPRA